MKKYFLMFVCMCALSRFFYAQTDAIRVSKIRVYFGECYYLWTTDGLELLDEDCSDAGLNALKIETVLTFLSIKPGFSGSEKEIVKRCKDSERRLTDSGYFYESSVMVVPPKKMMNERTLVVIVSSGYFMRYGGGNAWGMYGTVGIGGERQEVYAYVGYNKNGIRYLYSHLAGSFLSCGGSLFYYGPGEYLGNLDTENLENRFSGSVTLKCDCTPDLAIGIEPTIDGVGFSSIGYFSLQPFFTKREYLPLGSNSELGISARGFWYPVIDAVKMQISGTVCYGITEKVMLAGKGSIGSSPFTLPAPTRFDLYYTEDLSVRSGYPREKLLFSNVGFVSAELRYDFFEYRIPPMFDVNAQVFIFTDIAKDLTATVAKKGESFFDAYGLGLRVLFDNPIFAYFTLSYGINKSGDGRFLFSGTAGY